MSPPDPFFLTLLQKSFDIHSMSARLAHLSSRGEDRWKLVGDFGDHIRVTFRDRDREQAQM